MHRTQITLTDQQYERLRRESKDTGLSMAELIRRQLDAAEGPSPEDRVAALRASAGAWKDRELSGTEYVERLRGPGLGAKLGRLDLR